MKCSCFVILVFLFGAANLQAQDGLIKKDSLIKKVTPIPGKYLSQVKQKSDKMQRQVSKRSEQALSRFMKQEERLRRRLGKLDSLKANNLFAYSIDSLGSLKSRMKGKLGRYSGALSQVGGGQYLDSLGNSLAFLKESKGLLAQSKGITDKLNGSLKSVDNLKDKLAQAEQIKAYIRERKQLLKEQLSQYKFIPIYLYQAGSFINITFNYRSDIVSLCHGIINSTSLKVMWVHQFCCNSSAFAICRINFSRLNVGIVGRCFWLVVKKIYIWKVFNTL